MMSSEDAPDFSKIIKKQIAMKSNSNKGSGKRDKKLGDDFTTEA